MPDVDWGFVASVAVGVALGVPAGYVILVYLLSAAAWILDRGDRR